MKSLLAFLAFLSAYLTLGVDPPAEPEPEPEPAPIDEEPEPDVLEEIEEPEPDDPAVQLAAEREARQKAEREAADARSRYEEATRVRAAPPPPNEEQAIIAQENARLADPSLSAQERWQIESNRTLRASMQESRAARMEARETADLADFERLRATNPALIKKYAPEVEAKLKEIRGTGQNLTRRVILKMVIGDAIVEGRVTKKAAKADAKPDANKGKVVARGAPPSPRSDVSSRQRQTESAARRARLDSQII